MEIKRQYIKLRNSAELKQRINLLNSILNSCELCPRKCHINRWEGELGFCRSGKDMVVSSVFPHFAEEKELVGSQGSGTIFFTNCNLGCLCCQNFEISHLAEGEVIAKEQLAKNMLYLQEIGCHNINFVTPTHFVPQIIEALELAITQGLNLPLVYNCSGYENVEVIKLLEGIIDIYMPDIKYSDKINAKKYSNAEDYFERAKEAVLEMYRQVGDLVIENGIAQRGLIVRHLVLPNGASGSFKVLEFLAKEVSKDTFINIMNQYRPCFKANEFPEINRRVTKDEFNEALQMATKLGLMHAKAY
ncbi:MAG: radical SAM protein [Candidatus Omnitrophota bacterium]|nr:radical SAM protein [Candidatus Omnitrophota bacterium]